MLCTLLHLLVVTECFQAASTTRIGRNSFRLHDLITAEDKDFDGDDGRGGVRLAEESVVKVTGTIKHKPGTAEPYLDALIRYKSIEAVQESVVLKVLGDLGGKILCAGSGTELYSDPREGSTGEIRLAPLAAVKDALIGTGTAMQTARLVINFCGGDDAQVLELSQATEQMVLALEVSTKTKISFNSVSHETFPLGSSAVTVVSLFYEDEPEGLKGVEKAIAQGEVYFRDGRYWTVLEGENESSGSIA